MSLSPPPTPTLEVTMAATTPDRWSVNRAAWVAKGRPADPNDPHWASVLDEMARREAEAADPTLRRPVTPLVVLR